MEESAAGSQPPKLVDVPYDFQDPISHELMWDPVLLVESGHTYNRVSIQQWFQRGNRTCPKTNRRLKSLLVATNWTLRSLIESWAQKNGIPVPAPPQQPKLLCASQPSDALTSSGLQSHPILLGSSSTIASTSGEEHTGVIPESWTFFQGYDSVGGDLFRLQFDFASPVSPLMQLLEAADKVPNCIAFNSSGHLKAALKSRDSWVLCEEEPAGGLHVAGPRHEQVGLYVRTQCLPFIEAGCSSWAADAAAAPPTDSSGWTFFPGMDSPGGDICQAITQAHQEGAGAPPALTSVDGSITSSSAIALLALAKPIVVAFNSNGWLKTLLQPMHGWVKWTTEAGKGLFVRNDVLMALLSGVLAHVQGNQLAPVQLAGWTFIQGLDSLGGDVHWSWQNANEPVKLAEEACLIDGVIAFNTNGYIKTALRPRSHWTKVEVWADKPSSGIYVHNSVLWKLLIA